MVDSVQIGNATLYLGDCRAILPAIPSVSACITDPPYGTGWVRGGKSVGVFEASHEKPDWDVFSIDWLELVWRHRYVAAFCAPSFLDKLVEPFQTPHIGRYRKTNVRPGGRDVEFIVATAPWSAPRWEVEAYNGDNEYHPTQKPLHVMEWLIAHAPHSEAVLDPFMGSGTTGVACANLRRRFYGIEIDPKFFEIACRRIEAAQAQGRLFDDDLDRHAPGVRQADFIG